MNDPSRLSGANPSEPPGADAGPTSSAREVPPAPAMPPAELDEEGPLLAPGSLLLESLLGTGAELPIPVVTRLLGDVAVQIDALHAEGLLYDRLSPSAVEITDAEQALLLPAETVPMPGPGYLAPEQRHGLTSVQSDTYTLGVMAWELITGRRREAVLDGTHIAVMTEMELGPSRILRPGIGPLVNQAIERATNASLEVRYHSAGAFVADLVAALDPGASQRALLQPARQVDSEVSYSDLINHRRASTPLAKGFGLVLGMLLAVSIVAGAAYLGGRSPARFWKDDGKGKSTGFDWFGWKPSTVTSAPAPAPASASVAAGLVSVTVEGASAEVLLDGSPAGRSPILVPASTGPHMIQVRSTGRRFEPAAVTVRVNGNDTVSAVFRVLP